MKKIGKQTSKMDRKYVNILGINILSTSESSLLTAIEKKITDSYELGSRSSRFSILTPNPELILASLKNKELKNALNSADFAIPDGHGLDYASRYLYGKPLNIIPGRILFEKLIRLANNKGWKVFLLGGMGNEAELAKLKIVNSLKNENCKLKIESMGGKFVKPELTKEQINKINSFSPDLLFVAFGNPKQEIFVSENAKGQMLNAKCAMAVGGTFRYIAGMSSLPPKWMEQMGLEWVWRLINEPKRVGRIFNAFPIFPLRVFWFKFVGR